MPTIFKSKKELFRVLYSERTIYPVLRFLPADGGLTEADVIPGEFVGVASTPSMQTVAAKITSDAVAHAQAVNAAMRIGRTSNDVLESGALTVAEGNFHVRTELYLPGTYTQGQRLSLRFATVDGVGRGVPGTIHASSTDIIAQVVVPPQDGSKRTPMVIKVYSQAIPKTF